MKKGKITMMKNASNPLSADILSGGTKGLSTDKAKESKLEGTKVFSPSKLNTIKILDRSKDPSIKDLKSMPSVKGNRNPASIKLASKMAKMSERSATIEEQAEELKKMEESPSYKAEKMAKYASRMNPMSAVKSEESSEENEEYEKVIKKTKPKK